MKRRRIRVSQPGQVELLEDRCLLTVVSAFDSATGLLSVNADAADNIDVTAVLGEVKINGANPDTGVVFAEEVVAINVTATGNFPNVIDLRNVDPAVFGGVTGVTLKGGAGDDEIIAPRISSLVQGEDGNDVLLSGDGDDVIEGGAGNDLIYVLDGNDMYRGGDGDDIYEFVGNLPGGLGSNTFDETATGIDTFEFGQFTTGVTFDAGSTAAQAVAAGTTVTLQTGSTIEAITGGQAHDNLTAASGLNTRLSGGDGNDTLVGSSGNDTLSGDFGDDALDGGDGDDTFPMVLGQDTLTGGAGSDTMDFSANTAAVTFDLDDTGGSQSLGGPDGITLMDAMENVIGTDFADTFRADFPGGGVSRLIQGGDPTVVPGDQLIVDFQNQPGGYTMRGVGRGDYRILSGSFGQIDFESIEAPTAENVTTLNLTLRPDVPAGPYRMTREGEDTKFYNAENDIYGGMGHDQIRFVEFIGADFVDDEFIVDMSAGSLAVPGGIHVSGGDGGNDIATIIGDAGSDFLYTPSATTFGSGDVIGSADSFFLTFEGLEPLYVSGFFNVGLVPPNTDDVIAIATKVRVPGGLVSLSASGTSGGVPFEEAVISLSGTLTIDTTANNADGNDTINLNGGTARHDVDNLTIVTGVGNDVVNVTGDVELNGALTIETGGLVQGSGKVSASVSLLQGTISPGAGAPGILTVGNTTFTANATFDAEIDGPGTGSGGSDQLKVLGTIDLGGAALSFGGSDIVGSGPTTTIVLIDNDGNDAVVGTFAGRPDGAAININGQTFNIHYNGGDGNDVVLTGAAVPPMDVYVDDDLIGTATGTPIADANPDAPGNQPGTFGVDVFARVVDGVNAVASGGTVHVVGGIYNGSFSIDKPLKMIGTSGVANNVQFARTGPISIITGGDNVLIRHASFGADLIVDGVVAPTFQNVVVTNDNGLRGRNLTGTLTVADSWFYNTGTTSFDVESSGLGVLIQDSRFGPNTQGPFRIHDVNSVELNNVDFRNNWGGVKLSGIGTLIYDTGFAVFDDTIEFSESMLLHRRNGVDRDPLELTDIGSLLISTFGGENRISGSTNDSMRVGIVGGQSEDILTIVGSGGNDTFRVAFPSGTFIVPEYEIFNGSSAAIRLSGIDNLTFKGNGGDDRLTVDETNGLIEFASGITYHGGDGFDILALAGPNPVATTYTVGPDASSGHIQHTDGTATQNIRFTGLEPVLDIVPGDVTIVANGAANSVNLGTSALPGFGSVEVDGFERYEFFGKRDIRLQGGAGQDTFGVSNTDIGFAGRVIVEGGEPVDGDTLILAGTAGDDLFSYTPNPVLPNSGEFSRNGRVVEFHAIEDATVSGGLGDDSLVTTKAPLGRPATWIQTAPPPAASGAKYFGAVFPTATSAGLMPALNVFASDGTTELRTNEGVLSPFAAGGVPIPDGEQRIHLAVSSPVGRKHGNEGAREVELIGGIFTPEEFTTETEPNDLITDEIAVQIDHNHRVARKGSVGIGDTDLIAVQIDHNHRIAAIVNNDPGSSNLRTHSVLEILDTDGSTILAGTEGSLVAPAAAVLTQPLPAGTYFIRVTNGGDGDPEATDYELVVFDVFNELIEDETTDGDSGNDATSPGTSFGVFIPKHWKGHVPGTPDDANPDNPPENGRDDVVVVDPLGNRESNIRFNNSTPLFLSDFESVTVDPGRGTDTVIINGTANDDFLRVLAGPRASLNEQPFDLRNTENLDARLGDGADTAFTRGFSDISVDINGGESHGDYVSYQGSSRDLVVSTSVIDDEIREDGIPEEQRFRSFEFVNAVALGGNALLRHRFQHSVATITPGNNSIHVATDVSEKHVSINDAFDIAVTASFPTTFEFNGTQNDDTISVSDSRVEVSGFQPVDLILNHGDELRINGLSGADTFNVTPSPDQPIFIDGGNPIGFGDTLNIIATTATNHPGPQNDEGSWQIPNAEPVSYDHIESTERQGREGFVTQNTYADSVLFIDLQVSGYSGTQQLNLRGTSEWDVFFEPAERLASDDDGDGLDEVEAELVQLNVTGYSTLTGVARVSLIPSLTHEGEFEEQVNNSPGFLDVRPFSSQGSVNGFFNVSPQIEVLQTGKRFRVAYPINIAGGNFGSFPFRQANSLQSSDIFQSNLTQPVQLVDAADGQLSGLFITGMTYIPAGFFFDFGDAQEGAGIRTLAANHGASHAPDSNVLGLGVKRDIEADGQPTQNADGDDNDLFDDDDGVTVSPLASQTLERSLLLNATGDQFALVLAPDGGILDAWMDLNDDGDWDDAGEQIISGYVLSASRSDQTIRFSLPQLLSSGITSVTSRFRLSTHGSDSPLGIARDGEVEDYELPLVVLPGLSAPVPSTGGSTSPGSATTDTPSPKLLSRIDVASLTEVGLVTYSPGAAGFAVRMTAVSGVNGQAVIADAVRVGESDLWEATLHGLNDGTWFVTSQLVLLDENGEVTAEGTESEPLALIVETPDRPVIEPPPGPFRTPLPQLNWQPIVGAVSYEVELMNLTTGSDPSVIAIVDSFFRPENPLTLAEYQIRARAVFENSETTEFSDPVTFEVRSQVAFLGDRFSRDGLPEIQWTPVEGAVRYDLWVDNRSTGERQVIRERNLTETLFTPDEPLPIGLYVLWVRPYGENDFGGMWRATSLQVITPTTIIGPTGGIIGGQPTFEWEAVPGAETYDLWVRQVTPNPVSMLLRRQDLTSTTFTPDEPLPIGSFIFWVQPQGANGFQAAWSRGIRFSTFTQPSVTSPNSVTSTVNSAITWTPVVTAVSYDLEVTTGLGSIVINETNLTGTSFSPSTPFEFGTTFSVRVRAIDVNGFTGAWSATHNFTTPPAQVQLIEPGGTTTSLPIGPVTFSWHSVNGAVRYELWVNQISTGGPSQRVLHEPNLTTTQHTSASAFGAGEYRFWVRAVSAEGRYGAWSSPLSFVVASADERTDETDAVRDPESRLAVFLRDVDKSDRWPKFADVRSRATDVDRNDFTDQQNGAAAETKATRPSAVVAVDDVIRPASEPVTPSEETELETMIDAVFQSAVFACDE